MMKDFIFIFAFVLVSSTLTSAKEANDPKTKEVQMNMKPVNMMEVMTMCNESFRIDMSYLQALNDSGSFPDETDRTPKCYIRCLLEKTGVASEEGMYDPQMAGMVFAGERGGKVMTDVEDLAKSCAMRNEQCKCERAYQFMRCLMQKEIEEYEKAEKTLILQ